MKWLMFETGEERFPYRILIQFDKDKFYNFRVQNRWPGPGKSVFCLNDGIAGGKDIPQNAELSDECPVLTAQWFGKRLTVVLDRKTRRRCWFLRTEKKSKKEPRKVYEQVFWLTQTSRAKPGGTQLSVAEKRTDMHVVIDTREKYPYKFSVDYVSRSVLPSADYALKLTDGKLIAGVERMTRDNFFQQMKQVDAVKAKLHELCETYKYKAVVIESSYADLIDPKKAKFYRGGTVANFIANLTASFPDLQFTFCKNRKIANEWVARYFQAVKSMEESG